MTTQDQIDQILATLGTDPEGIYANVRVRLDILEARINNPSVPSPNVTNPFYIDGYGGVSISVGDGYPTESRNNGSMYLRRDGVVTEGLYLRRSGSWELVGGAGASIHNNLSGLQGGSLTEQYHLTSAQHTWLSNGYSSGWTATSGGTDQTAYATGDILYASATNTLSRLSAGTNGQFLKLSGGVPSWSNVSTVQESGTNIWVGTGTLASITYGTKNTAIGIGVLPLETGGSRNTVVGYNSSASQNDGYDNSIFGNTLVTSLTNGYRNTVVGSNTFVNATGAAHNIVIGTYSANSFAGSQTNNVLIGNSCAAIVSDASSNENVFIGNSTGNNLIYSTKNVIIGYSAVSGMFISPTISEDNVVIGHTASAKLIGSANVTIGAQCSALLESGAGNIILGKTSADSLTTGSYNVAIGDNAMSTGVSTASQNICIGTNSYTDNTDASIVIGYGAQGSNTGSISIGKYSSTSHNYSLVIGAHTSLGSRVSMGDNTAALYYSSLYLGKDAAENIVIYAHNADTNLPYLKYVESTSKWVYSNDGVSETDIGSGSGTDHNSLNNLQGGQADGYYHLTPAQHTWATDGYSSGGTFVIESATQNVAAGTGSLSGLTTGDYNVALGYNSGSSLTIGENNTIVGNAAFSASATSSTDNVIMGYQAGLNSSASYCVVIGSGAGTSISESYNVIIGSSAGYRATTSQQNVLIGHKAGSIITTGDENIAIGYNALGSIGYSLTNNANIAIGVNALTATIGVGNIALGWGASTSVNSNDYSISIGYSADASGGDYAVVIGYSSTSSHNNALVIGRSLASKGDYTALIGYPSAYIGKNAAEDIFIYAYTNAANTPYLKYNNSTSKWQYSNDGLSATDIGSGGGATDHNLLTNLQGGQADGYYHLTPSQHTWLTDGYTDGYWKETKGGTGQTSYTTGDIIYASSTNKLSKLSIGSDTQVLTVSGGLPSWQTGGGGTSNHNALTNLQGGEADGYYHLTPTQHTNVIKSNYTDWHDFTATRYSDGYFYIPSAVTDEMRYFMREGMPIRHGDSSTLYDGYYAIINSVSDTLSIHNGTASSGTINSITADGVLSVQDQVIVITGGTGSGQIRRIIDIQVYVSPPSSFYTVMTVDTNWSTTPDNTSTFQTYISAGIAGPTIDTSHDGYFQYSSNSKVQVMSLFLQDTYASAASTTLLNDIIGTDMLWFSPTAHLVKFDVYNKTNDSGASKPHVNVTLANNAVSTSNSNNGLEVSTTHNSTIIDINASNYTILFNERIEISTDAAGTNNDAADLTVTLIFVIE